MKSLRQVFAHLLLLPLAGVVVAFSLLSGEPATGNALALLLVAALVLLGTVLVWGRREGLVSPIPIVAFGLFVYFPVRGLVLLTSSLTPEQGINANVLDALAMTGPVPASLEVLSIAVVFAIACEAIWRFGWGRHPSRSRRPEVETNSALSGWGTGLLFAGLVGIALQVPKGIGFLKGDEITGGLTVQIILLASFAFGLGVILSGRVNGKLRPHALILLVVVTALAFYMGSKDTLVQPLLALLFAGAAAVNTGNPKRRLLAVGLTAGLLVLLVFPAVTTYRRLIVDGGQTPSQALAAMPGELVDKTVVSGSPRTDGPAGYLQDSLLYMTNRLNGFDMMLLTTQAPRDPQLLPLQTILLSPLGVVVPSSYWSPSPPQVGHYFGQRYWGSVPSNNVSIAMTIFGEAQLTYGPLAVIFVAALLGIITSNAASRFRSPDHATRAAGFVLMVTAVGFEHDILNLVVTTERRLVLLAIIVALATARAGNVTQDRAEAVEPRQLAGAGVAR